MCRLREGSILGSAFAQEACAGSMCTKHLRGQPLRAFGVAVFLALALVAGLAAPAHAESRGLPQVITDNQGLISELRLGFLWHDLDEKGRRVEDGYDLNAEILFARPQLDIDNRFVRFLLTPRPHLGGSFHTGGDTSQVYAGFSWDIYLFGPVFFEASLGGVVHTGQTTGISATRHSYGCRVMFRESLSLGVDVTPQMRVMAMVDHISHAGLCGSRNPGLTNAGVRLGYLF